MKAEITGNVPNLITAFYAVLSIPEKNFNMKVGFGDPFTIDARGRCRLSAPPVSWVIQHPDIKAQGIKLEQATPKAAYAPIMHITPKMKNYDGVYALRGFHAVARVLGVPSDVAYNMFSPYSYKDSDKVTSADVAKRIKAVINKVGGRAELAAKEKALNAHKNATVKANAATEDKKTKK